MSAADKAVFDQVVNQKYSTTNPEQIKQRQDNIAKLETAIATGKKASKKRPAQAAIDDLKLDKLKSKLDSADPVTRDRFYNDFAQLDDAKKTTLRAIDNDEKLFEAWKTADKLSANTRTKFDFLNKLKELRANTELQDHIFKIHQQNNKVSGRHIQSIINGTTVRYKDGIDGGLKPPANSPTNSYGVLNADIEVLRTLKNPDQTPQRNSDGSEKQIWQIKRLSGGDIQTFFPTNWSKDKILAECASALINPQRGLAAGKSRLWEAASDSGVVMRWFFDVNNANEVASIFPKL